METKLYNQQAQEVGKIDLPDNIFGVKWNPALVWQIAESERANLRQGSAHTKDRSEVRGGGRKPWQQKGTGRARHGSRRSPIWVGGGITHGPRNEKIYVKKINKKMKSGALAAALSQKLRDEEILVVDTFNFPSGKTKEANFAIRALNNLEKFEGIGTKSTAAVALGRRDLTSFRALRNLPKVSVLEARNLDLLETLGSRFLILTKDGIDVLKERIASRTPKNQETHKPSNPST